MAEQTLSVEVRNLGEVNDYLGRLPESTFFHAKNVFREAVLASDATVKRRFESQIIKARTGALRRSLRTSITGTKLSSLKASFFSAANVGGTAVKYAPLQEYGGTVRAIDKYRNVLGGPYLNIPTSANRTPAGVMRKSARMLFNEGAYIQKSSAGNWGVFLGSQMMMVLRKQVTIPARLGMVDAADEQIPTILSRLANLIGEE